MANTFGNRIICAVEQVSVTPPLLIGTLVGFVWVVDSKEALAQTQVEQIRVEGRKGGSLAAAIINALIVLAT